MKYTARQIAKMLDGYVEKSVDWMPKAIAKKAADSKVIIITTSEDGFIIMHGARNAKVMPKSRGKEFDMGGGYEFLLPSDSGLLLPRGPFKDIDQMLKFFDSFGICMRSNKIQINYRGMLGAPDWEITTNVPHSSFYIYSKKIPFFRGICIEEKDLMPISLDS